MSARAALLCTWCITLAGLALGLIGVRRVMLGEDVTSVMLPLLASLACDALDGAVARAMSVETRAGAIVDWTIDTSISYALTYACAARLPMLAVACSASLVGVQSWACYTGRRFSGRTLVTIVVLVALFTSS